MPLLGDPPSPYNRSTSNDTAAFGSKYGVSFGGAMPSGPSPDDPPVYFGRKRQRIPAATTGRRYAEFEAAGRDPGGSWTTVDETKPLSVAVYDPYTWSEKRRRGFWERLSKAGIIGDDENYSFPKVMAVWEKFTEDSVKRNMATGQKTTPWDMIGLYSGETLIGSKKKKANLKPYSVTTKYSDTTPAGTARSMLNRMLSDKLGRGATEEELDEFVEALNTAEEDNPKVVTSRYAPRNGQMHMVKQTSRGGVSADAFADQYLQDDEWDEETKYAQALPTYFNVVLDVARGI